MKLHQELQKIKRAYADVHRIKFFKGYSPIEDFDAGRGDLALKTKQQRKWDRERGSDSKPKGNHNVFTHFPKYSNCEVRRMTKTARARCKNRALRLADGISRPLNSEN